MTNVQQEPAEQGPQDEYQIIDRLIEENLFPELSKFVAIETYRGGRWSEDQVVANLGKIHDALKIPYEVLVPKYKLHI